MEVYRPVSSAPRFGAIKAFIQSRIADPALCLADVAAAQGISTSYVRKLFAAQRLTFARYVLDIRLGNVLRMLRDPEDGGLPISAIALKCGFGDISHFNRVFRRRYGCTPSDIRATQPPPANAPAQPDTLLH